MKRYKGVREPQTIKDCELITKYLKTNKSVYWVSVAVRELIRKGKISKKTAQAHHEAFKIDNNYPKIRKMLAKRLLAKQQSEKKTKKIELLGKINKECQIIEKYLQEHNVDRIWAVRELQRNGVIRNTIKAASHLDNLYNRIEKR